MTSQGPLEVRICSWRGWEALIGLLTPEFALDANGKLLLDYEPIMRTYHLTVKIKFVIHKHCLVLWLFYKRNLFFIFLFI